MANPIADIFTSPEVSPWLYIGRVLVLFLTRRLWAPFAKRRTFLRQLTVLAHIALIGREIRTLKVTVKQEKVGTLATALAHARRLLAVAPARAPLQRPLSIFLFFLGVFSGCTYALEVHSHHLSAALAHFVTWCPGFAALCTCLLLRIPLGTLGWGWPARRFLWLAYFLPLIYAAPVYLLTWLFIRGAFSLNSFEAAMADTYGLGRWPALGTFGVALPLLFTVEVIGEAVWALGEQLGWQGFLFPRLHQRFGFHRACLILGSIWAVWHYPEILWADFNVGTNAVFALACFTVMLVALAYVMGYLRVRSGSIWPCVLLAATHNTFVQGIFEPLTAPVGWANYITTEFGAGLAAAIVVAGTVIVSTGRPREFRQRLT